MLQSMGWPRVGHNLMIEYDRVKKSAYNAGDIGDVSSIPGSGRDYGGGNGNPLHYSHLQSPMSREPGGLQSTGL